MGARTPPLSPPKLGATPMRWVGGGEGNLVGSVFLQKGIPRWNRSSHVTLRHQDNRGSCVQLRLDMRKPVAGNRKGEAAHDCQSVGNYCGVSDEPYCCGQNCY